MIDMSTLHHAVWRFSMASSKKTKTGLPRNTTGTVTRVSGITYVHIPSDDPVKSAAFYHAVFGWQIRGGPTHQSFSDGTGHVIGAWVADIPIAGEAGVLPYIYVASVDDSLAAVTKHGGHVVKAPYPEGNLWVATFRDPAGTVVGLWQDAPR
jgi:predicted enzyme related to lactoylglutathione lyase